MRLDPNEQAHIVRVLRTYGLMFEILLCGSRVHDHLRGGDIDLFLVVPNPKAKEALRKLREQILVELKDSIGDQKIDLTIATTDESAQKPIYGAMLKDSIHLDGVRI